MAGEYEKAITIEKAIHQIVNRRYLLPAIQRKFTWSSSQICVLFDSIMRGYPINTFMFWEVREPEVKKSFRFYQFLERYCERFEENNPDFDTKGHGDFFAVIDGQQRLTSLYIGLKGTYAYKLPRKWWPRTKDDSILPQAQTLWFPCGAEHAVKLESPVTSSQKYQISWKCSIDSVTGKLIVREETAFIDSSKLKSEFEQIMFVEIDSSKEGVFLIDTSSKKHAYVFPDDGFIAKEIQWKTTDSTYMRFEGWGTIDTILTDEMPGDRRAKTDSLLLLSEWGNNGKLKKRFHLVKGIGPVYVNDLEKVREYRITSWRTSQEKSENAGALLTPVPVHRGRQE